MNNAQLASVATYEELVPAFRALLAREDGDMGRFYAEVRRLAQLDAGARAAALAALAAGGLARGSAPLRRAGSSRAAGTRGATAAARSSA